MLGDARMSSELERLKHAAQRDPASVIKLADTLVAAGRAEEAVQWCRQALLKRNDDVAIRLALGRALSAAGHLEEAQAALLDAVSRQQRRPGAGTPEPKRAEALGARQPHTPTGDWQVAMTPLPPPMAPEPEEALEPETMERRPRAEAPPASASASPAAPAAWRTPIGQSGSWAAVPPGSGGEPTQETFDLERVAETLLGGGARGAESTIDQMIPEPAPDAHALGFARKRARAFAWLWASLFLVVGGIVGTAVWRAMQKQKMLAATVEKADARVKEATFDGDNAARELYQSAVRAAPKDRKFFAMAALAAARLHADQGADTDAAAWAMLRRSEKEAAKHTPEPDARADRELRQARALLALARGEACPTVDDAADGDVAARCALQRGEVDKARKILADTIQAGGDRESLRALLALGSLELGAGDLEAAQGAYDRVLQVSPQHPRAIVGRALIALERGEAPQLELPKGPPVGVTTEAWFHLAQGLAALAGKTSADEARADAELEIAKKGLSHDGRLALLYGRARLAQGRLAEAEQAMRIAERLDPNDADVAVLDAEVALAKGFEDKVAEALAVTDPRGSTPRRLAVLGRAQALIGRHREAAATLDAALARRPGDAVAVTYRAIARAKLGDQSGAIKELEKAAAHLPSNAPHYGLGLLAYERRDLLRARTELSMALERNSESFRARALLGRVLRDLGKPKEALAELERAAHDAPQLLAVHAALGRLYLDLGRDREARAELRKVLDVPGRASADDRLAYAEATINLGLVKDGEKSLAEALEAGALQTKAARPKLLLQSWKGPKEAAAAAKALEKERKGAAAHDARLALATGHAWRRAGDPKRAADLYRAALLGDPLHANLGLGRLELVGGDLAQAESSFRQALAAWAQGPYGVDDQTEARVGLARALLGKKAAEEAVKTLEPCLTEDPLAPEPRFWLARAHLDLGKPAAARTHAEKAVELDDGYAEAWFLLGELTRATAKDRARVAYKKVLELAPDGANAKAAKKALANLK